MKSFYKTIWDLSEFIGVGLGRFAPFVFERMIEVKGTRIDKLPIWALSDEEYDESNPPPQIHKYINDKLFVEHINDHNWLNVGYIPMPNNRIGWFMYHFIHGLFMKYPIHKVILYSFAHTKMGFENKSPIDSSGSAI